MNATTTATTADTNPNMSTVGNANTNMTMKVISSLREVATVPVYVGERPNEVGGTILISELKVAMLTDIYEQLYMFTYTAWRNLPEAPGCDPPFVIMWMLSAEDYEINHSSITWKGSSPNTFVHVWSMVERLRSTFVSMGMEWLIGSRDTTGYCLATGMSGPADAHLYTREIVTPPQAMVAIREMPRSERLSVSRDFASFFDFETAMMMPGSRWRTRS